MNNFETHHETQDLEDMAKDIEFEYEQSKEDLRELEDMLHLYQTLLDINFQPIVENFFYATLKMTERFFNLVDEFETTLFSRKCDFSSGKIQLFENLLPAYRNNCDLLLKTYIHLANQYITQFNRTPKNIFNSTLFSEIEKSPQKKEISSELTINMEVEKLEKTKKINHQGCLPNFFRKKEKELEIFPLIKKHSSLSLMRINKM